MNSSSALMSAGEALARIEHTLDLVDARRADLAPQDRLAWLRLARRVQGRVEALTVQLTAEAEQTQSSLRASGTPLASWLGVGENLSRREAAAAVLQARTIAEHPAVGRAATAGRVSPGQAQAIGRVLAEVAPQLPAERRSEAEDRLIELAGTLSSAELSRCATRVLAEFATPDEDAREQRLQQLAEAGYRRRSLRFFREAAAIRFEGVLPLIEGEAFVALISTHGEALRRSAIEARDPFSELSPDQRRADALMSLLKAAQQTRPEPGVGQARVVVRLDYAALQAAAAGAGLIREGEQLAAGELRRICCEAELLPAVLGGASEVLDVGRASRLVTPGLRVALGQRDGGCTFPGCDVPESACEAHHLIPWWAAGRTSLGNMSLLCHHHHALVEPAKFGTRDQWELRIAADGLPEFLPPARLDRLRRPVRHRRLGGSGRLADDPDTGRLGHEADTGRLAHETDTGPLAHETDTGPLAHETDTGPLAHKADTGRLAHKADTGRLAHKADTGRLAHKADTGRASPVVSG